VLAHPRGPVHVRIAHQRKAGLHALLDESVGEDIVDMWFGFSRHCNFPKRQLDMVVKIFKTEKIERE
jgi:hypothetical protein